jgi:hypothetical protein
MPDSASSKVNVEVANMGVICAYSALLCPLVCIATELMPVSGIFLLMGII